MLKPVFNHDLPKVQGSFLLNLRICLLKCLYCDRAGKSIKSDSVTNANFTLKLF